MLHKVPQTLTFRIWQLAALAMIAVVALCFTTYWHLDNTQDADHEVAETLQVLREMNRLGRYTSDAQSAHLRFALVGRDEYLASYELWISLAKVHWNVVRPLLTNTAGQRGSSADRSGHLAGLPQRQHEEGSGRTQVRFQFPLVAHCGWTPRSLLHPIRHDQPQLGVMRPSGAPREAKGFGS